MSYLNECKGCFLTLLLIILFSFSQNSLAQTYVCGDVKGTWTAAESPYWVTCDIAVPEDDTLIIEDGVDVYFVGTYSFKVFGLLQARGREENKITFYGGGGAGDWKDIYFAPSALPGCILDYCVVKDGGYEDHIEIYTQYYNTVYTNIFICNNDTNITISHCEVTNSAGDGILIKAKLGTHGGDNITKICKPNIVQNIIFDNKNNGIKVNSSYFNSFHGAHYNTSIASPLIKYNLIFNNRNNAISCITNATGSRGPWDPDWNSTIQTNPTIQQNTLVGNGASGIYCKKTKERSFENVIAIETNPFITSNIISNNDAYGIQAIQSVKPDSVRHNDFWTNDSSNFSGINEGIGILHRRNLNGDSCDVFMNIFFDPGFVEEMNYDFFLTDSSRCINAGDLPPILSLDPDSTIADIGAYYYDQRMLVSPDSLDFGEVLVGKTKTKTITIKNKGNSLLTVTSIYLTGNFAGRFMVETTPFSLEPDSIKNLAINFTPDREGSFNAMLLIKSNGGNATVLLIGNGIPLPDPNSPLIFSITDVPNDQGKQVLITWNRSRLDSIGSDTLIIMYNIWRRVDHLALGGMLKSNNSKVEFEESKNIMATPKKFVNDIAEMLNHVSNATPGTIYMIGTDSTSKILKTSSTSNELWTYVGSLPAMQFEQYSIVAATLFDSTEAGIVYSTFFISAHTINPQLWFRSAPDSGYSVDNLSPAAPSGLMAIGGVNGVELKWNSNSEQDFYHYSIYRDKAANFELTEPFAYTTDTSFIDNNVEAGKTYYYKITAMDSSGNESLPSIEANVLISSVDNISEIPTEYALAQNYPNPFNPVTEIKFEIPKSCFVSLKIYNVLGQEICALVAEKKTPGIYRITWDGRDKFGQYVKSGLYFYRLETDDFSQIRKMIYVR